MEGSREELRIIKIRGEYSVKEMECVGVDKGVKRTPKREVEKRGKGRRDGWQEAEGEMADNITSRQISFKGTEI